MTRHDDPAALTATQALARLLAGQLSAQTLTRACLARIALRDPAVRAWVHVDADVALAQAAALDALPADRRGPLHGLPVGVKDVILTRDMPTRFNSPLHPAPRPTGDAACVARLRAAGAVILGKTATVEFAAIGRPPATRNPHDLSRTPGGSSSGSAAAVADGQVPLALGTQTGGSMIRPASFCGVWAMKPTWGRVSNEGCRPFAPSLDTLGWFGRSPGDLALILDVLDPQLPPLHASPPPPEPTASPLRIGLCRTPMWDRADADTQNALTSLVDRLRDSGAQVAEMSPPPGFAHLPALQRLIMRAQGRVSFRAEREGLEGAMRDMAEGVDVATDAQLVAALGEAVQARPLFDRAAAPFDAVLTPSAVGEAPAGLAGTGDLLFNGLWTLLHVPCVNLPGATGSTGLPIGLTLTGPRFSDHRVLRTAQSIAELL